MWRRIVSVIVIKMYKSVIVDINKKFVNIESLWKKVIDQKGKESKNVYH